MYAAAGLTEELEAEVIFAETRDAAEDWADRTFYSANHFPTSGVFVQDNQGGFSVVRGDGPDLFLLADRVAGAARTGADVSGLERTTLFTHLELGEYTRSVEYTSPNRPPRLIRAEIAAFYPDHCVISVDRYRSPEVGTPEAEITLIDKRDVGKRPLEWEYPPVSVYVNFI